MAKISRKYLTVAIIAAATLISIVAVTSQQASARSPFVTTIKMPTGDSLETTFDPEVVRVVVGVNNTVRWINEDKSQTWIEANNIDQDPDFYGKSLLPDKALSTFGQKPSNVLNTGESWEYTFTKPGTIEYHAKPWQYGTIIVEAPDKASK